LAEFFFAEVGDVVAHGVGEGHEEPVVGDFDEAVHPASSEAASSPDDDGGDVVKGVGVSLSEFVDPDDCGVVEHVAIASRFWSFAEFSGEVGELLSEPDVDLFELILSLLILIGFVTKGMVAVIDAEPIHASLSDGTHELQGADACHVIGHGVDEKIDLHACDLGSVIIDEFDIWVEFGLGMDEFILLRGSLHFLLELADEFDVLL